MAGHPSRLSDEAKDFATMCFARFMRPTQVARAVFDRYGVSIERNYAQTFDPTTSKGKALGKKRKALFDEIRKRFLEELEEIPIANKMVRLQQLQAHYEKAADDGNVRLALDVLEKAAKEAGGFHTNETKVHHSGKVAIEDKVTEDEMRNGIAVAIATALQQERDKRQGVTKH